MFVQYGNYTHALNEAKLSIDKKMLETDAHVCYGIEETWTIRGFLQAPDIATLNAAIAGMQLGYALNYQNVALCFDTGAASIHKMLGVSPLGGTWVVKPPSFPTSDQGEFSTWRNYEIVIQGRYPLPNGFNSTVKFKETLSIQGGGPRFVILQPLTGTPIKQMVADQTPCSAAQEGEATGLYAYPAVPAPIFPWALKQDRVRVQDVNAERTGLLPLSLEFHHFTRTWHYEFEDIAPLAGEPTQWLT